MTRGWMGAVVAGFAVMNAGVAAETVPPSVAGYGRQNPTCQAWSDGCTICAIDGTGASRCSTPGIACTPHDLNCDTKWSDTEKAAPR